EADCQVWDSDSDHWVF
nr:immunoglobulin light chain junction region [Macaca mulatta]